MTFKVIKSGWYRTRDGQEVECVAIWTRPCGNGFQATLLDKNESYDVTINGRYFVDPEYEHELDVVEYLGKDRPKEKVKHRVTVYLWSNGKLYQDSDGLVVVCGDPEPYCVESRVIEWESMG